MKPNRKHENECVCVYLCTLVRMHVWFRHIFICIIFLCILWKFVSGGSLGPVLFSVKGNQCEGWKPAVVRYTGTAAIQVIAGTWIWMYLFKHTHTHIQSYEWMDWRFLDTYKQRLSQNSKSLLLSPAGQAILEKKYFFQAIEEFESNIQIKTTVVRYQNRSKCEHNLLWY